MKVVSDGIQNGKILDKYGKRGAQKNKAGIATCSLPFTILDAPQGTKSFAIVLEDKDAVPVTKGFSWIHWTACNITKTEVKENASQTDKDFVQGLNSWTSTQGGSLPEQECCCYGGMGAPDCPHTYELHIFALDCMLELEKGFWLNALYRAMEGHVLGCVVLKGEYDN